MSVATDLYPAEFEASPNNRRHPSAGVCVELREKHGDEGWVFAAITPRDARAWATQLIEAADAVEAVLEPPKPKTIVEELGLKPGDVLRSDTGVKVVYLHDGQMLDPTDGFTWAADSVRDPERWKPHRWSKVA